MIEGWECVRCKAGPISMDPPALSPDMTTGICSDYACPSRSPVKHKLKGGGKTTQYSNSVGKTTFRRIHAKDSTGG